MDATEDVVVLEEIKRYDEVGSEVLEEKELQITLEKVSISYDLTNMNEKEKKKFFDLKVDVWGAPLHDFRVENKDDEMPDLEELDEDDKNEMNKK